MVSISSWGVDLGRIAIGERTDLHPDSSTLSEDLGLLLRRGGFTSWRGYKLVLVLETDTVEESSAGRSAGWGCPGPPDTRSHVKRVHRPNRLDATGQMP